MQTHLCLTGFLAVAEEKNNPFWQTEFDLQSQHFCREFLAYFEDELFRLKDDVNAQNLTTVCLRDLIECKSQDKDVAVIADFLHFLLCGFLSFHFVNNKIPTYAFNWIANALDGVENDVERTVTLDRITTFITSTHPFIKQEFANALSRWVYALLYYSRTNAGHINTANEFLKVYGHYYFRLPVQGRVFDEYFLSICQLLSWAIEYNKQEWIGRTCRLLLSLLNSELPAELKKEFLLQFSCLDAEYTGQPREVWAGQLLEHHSDRLIGHQRMHAWVNFTANSSSKILQNLDTLLSTITEYHEFIENSHADKSMVVYELVQIYSIIYPSIITLLIQNHITAAERIFSRFFKIGNPLQHPTLHIIPNDRQGIVYSGRDGIFIIRSRHENPMLTLVKCLNEFLQLIIALKGQADYQPVAVTKQKMGTPVEAKANSFLSALRNHFQFDLITDFLNDGQFIGYYLHNGHNYPLQPVMLSQTGKVLPMSLSFQQPENPRQFRRVLLWQGDSLLSGWECDGLIAIFAKAKIDCSLFVYDRDSITDFIQAYESDDYDCIIVSGHGIYDHYEPHSSYIHLSEEQRLGRADFNQLKDKWNGRRLLFLNICDGAATALHNSPLALGIATQLIHAKQSLFSHFWPVNPRIACLYSWLIAVQMIKTNDYAAIYRETVLTLSKGKEEVTLQLKEFFDHEFLETVQNLEIDLANFTHWGSLAYFE